MRFWKSKRGLVWLYVSFMIMAMVIVIIAGVLAPMGVMMNTKFMEAGMDILEMTQDDLNAINDTDVKESINGTINNALDAGVDNIDVQGDIFQYSWIFIIVLAAIIVFLAARRIVEFGGGAGFV